MLNKNTEVVFIDLGLGNFMKPDELLSTFCGSTAYAAPEMFLCQVLTNLSLSFSSSAMTMRHLLSLIQSHSIRIM